MYDYYELNFDRSKLNDEKIRELSDMIRMYLAMPRNRNLMWKEYEEFGIWVLRVDDLSQFDTIERLINKREPGLLC